MGIDRVIDVIEELCDSESIDFYYNEDIINDSHHVRFAKDGKCVSLHMSNDGVNRAPYEAIVNRIEWVIKELYKQIEN